MSRLGVALASGADLPSDGYFHTGDIAYCDRKSKLWYIVDRKKVSTMSSKYAFEMPEY